MKCIEIIDARYITKDSFVNPEKVERIIFIRNSKNDRVMSGIMIIKGGNYFSYMRPGNMGLIGSSGGINAILDAKNWIKRNCPNVPVDFFFCENIPIDIEVGDEFLPDFISEGDSYHTDKSYFYSL